MKKVTKIATITPLRLFQVKDVKKKYISYICSFTGPSKCKQTKMKVFLTKWCSLTKTEVVCFSQIIPDWNFVWYRFSYGYKNKSLGSYYVTALKAKDLQRHLNFVRCIFNQL